MTETEKLELYRQRQKIRMIWCSRPKSCMVVVSEEEEKEVIP